MHKNELLKNKFRKTCVRLLYFKMLLRNIKKTKNDIYLFLYWKTQYCNYVNSLHIVPQIQYFESQLSINRIFHVT